jgi:hypothetical protein
LKTLGFQGFLYDSPMFHQTTTSEKLETTHHKQNTLQPSTKNH